MSVKSAVYVGKELVCAECNNFFSPPVFQISIGIIACICGRDSKGLFIIASRYMLYPIKRNS